jgi:hypothetical protein
MAAHESRDVLARAPARGLRGPIAEELRHILCWTERHQRLIARLAIALCLTAVVDLVGSVLVWQVERGHRASGIHSLGGALFFTTVQLLTVSSSMKNPVSTAGRLLDVVFEAWGVFVITAVAGSFAAFFRHGEPGREPR